MKYLPLVWSGTWRKPVRTALIFLQVCVAFTLFGVVQGMKTGMDRAIANTPADVLYVGPAVYGEPPLPIADLSRLQSIPGVKTVSFNYGVLNRSDFPRRGREFGPLSGRSGGQGARPPDGRHDSPPVQRIPQAEKVGLLGGSILVMVERRGARLDARGGVLRALSSVRARGTRLAVLTAKRAASGNSLLSTAAE
jgi:hypothetical protein